MLRGKAQSFYYQHLVQKYLSFHTMVDKTRAYFNTLENHRLFLNDWRTIMLRDIVINNPDNDFSQRLEIVIQRLCCNGSCIEKLKLLGLYLISPSEASCEIEESKNYSGELLIKPTWYQSAI